MGKTHPGKKKVTYTPAPVDGKVTVPGLPTNAELDAKIARWKAEQAADAARQAEIVARRLAAEKAAKESKR